MPKLSLVRKKVIGKRKILILLLGLLSFICLAQEPDKHQLDLAIGIDVVKKLDYKFSPKIQIGNPSVIKLVLNPAKQEIIFRGIQAGETSVTIKDLAQETRDVYIVNVTSDGLSNTVKNLRELLGDIEGIEIGIQGGKVVVKGEIIVPSVIGRINTVLANYPEVLKLVELSNQTQTYYARKIQEEINKNNMKDVTVRVLNGDFWLEGVVNGGGKKELAEAIAKQYLPDKLASLAQQAGGDEFSSKEKYQVINFITVNEKKDPPPPKKLIKITAQFVELTKSYSKAFGFSWTPALSGGGSISFGQNDTGQVGTSNDGTLSGTISNLFPKLSAGRSAGYARVLQSGMVVTKEGEVANISKNRNLPFAVGSGDFQQAATTDISFKLNVTPSLGANETIDLKKLNISVSLPAESVNGNPTTTENSITTDITIKTKESAAIGGVVQSTSATDYDRTRPGGSVSGSQSTEDASPLFDLLRSKAYNTSKSQFVIFVTPEILESASAGTADIKKKFRKRQR